MKSYKDEFLQEFRRCEETIRQIGDNRYSFRDMEMQKESSDPVFAQKMTLSRQIRNYASHNTDIDTFLPIPKELVTFMGVVNKELLKDVSLVKDCMSRAKALTDKDNLQAAAGRLSKLSAVPVVDAKGELKGLFDAAALAKAVNAGATPKGKLSKITLTKIPSKMITAKDVAVKDLEKGFYVVVNPKTKKYEGVVEV